MTDGYVYLYQAGWSSERVAHRITAVEAVGNVGDPDTSLIITDELDERNDPILA